MLCKIVIYTAPFTQLGYEKGGAVDAKRSIVALVSICLPVNFFKGNFLNLKEPLESSPGYAPEI